MQKFGEQISSLIPISPKISRKRLLVPIFFIAMLGGLPGIIVVSFAVILYIGSVQKKLAGSQYSLKDLWGNQSKEAWAYLDKINKIDTEKTISDDVSTKLESDIVNGETDSGHTSACKTPNESEKNIIGTAKPISKTGNSIAGIIIILVFLISLIKDTPFVNQALHYLKTSINNISHPNNTARQTGNSSVLRIILAILVVFIIFVAVNTILSFRKPNKKLPFNS